MPGEPRACVECGTEFTPAHNRNAMTCSRPCRRERENRRRREGGRKSRAMPKRNRDVHRALKTPSAQGHSFGEDLACKCGQTWEQQQRDPTTCTAEHPQRTHRWQAA